MTKRGRHLIFYTRPQCHLCAVAAPRVRRAALLARVALQEVDIDHHPDLAVDYVLRIPVVEDCAGQILAEGEINTLRLWTVIVKKRWKRIRGE